MRGVGHGGWGGSGAGRVLPAGDELNFRFKHWQLATFDHLFLPLTDKRHKLNCLIMSLDVRMSSLSVQIYVCISNWFIVYWYKSIIGLNWRLMLLNNCWFCAAFFAAFCEDFKSEINKLNKKNKLLRRQRRFVYNKREVKYDWHLTRFSVTSSLLAPSELSGLLYERQLEIITLLHQPWSTCHDANPIFKWFHFLDE